MRRLAVLVMIAAAGSASADDYLKIASMNIEHLGSRTPPQRPADLAEHVALIGADVLGLIEIDDTDGVAGTRTNSALDTTISLLNAGGQREWAYMLFPNRVASDETQLVGVAWNKKRVQQVDQPLKIAVGTAPSGVHAWDRHPHAIKFQAGQGKTDLVVIVVHMKANVPTATIGRNQRKLEAKMLADQLPTVRQTFSDQDVVILGDTNILYPSEPALATFETSGFRLLNDTAGTFVGPNSPPFDRIFVPEAQPEFAASRQYILTPAASDAHNEYLSDHFAVMTSVKIVADDD